MRRPAYGPNTQVALTGRIPLIDIGTVGLIRAGKIRVRRGIARFEGDEVVFDDGARDPFDAVVLATGYTLSLERFLTPADQKLPGIHLCGFFVSPKGMLWAIGREAEQIAHVIARSR